MGIGTIRRALLRALVLLPLLCVAPAAPAVDAAGGTVLAASLQIVDTDGNPVATLRPGRRYRYVATLTAPAGLDGQEASVKLTITVRADGIPVPYKFSTTTSLPLQSPDPANPLEPLEGHYEASDVFTGPESHVGGSVALQVRITVDGAGTATASKTVRIVATP